MSPHPYTEDQLVEQPAIARLAELGWAYSLLKEGVPVSVPCLERGGQQTAEVSLLMSFSRHVMSKANFELAVHRQKVRSCAVTWPAAAQAAASKWMDRDARFAPAGISVFA